MNNHNGSVHVLENSLGSPFDKNSPINFSDSLKYDELEEFPQKHSEILQALHLQNYFIPSAYGGELKSFEEMSLVYRSIFRRDATLGLGFGVTTFMAAINVWLFGREEQKEQLSRDIKNKKSISVAYHEKKHGNDVLGNELTANKIENRLSLSGEKWLINNASTSSALVLFSKTDNKIAPRNYSLLYIDKAKIDQQTLYYLPKVKTVGVRGCAISGIGFNKTLVDADEALIGELGQGYEYTLKAFQVTRTILPGMALGMIDTALRTVIDYLCQRTLYRDKAINLQHVKENIADVFVKLTLCDGISRAATRMLHQFTDQVSLTSAIVKYAVPIISQSCLKKLSILLGSRFYIREGECGIFQKIMRDYPVVTLGHASSDVCLAMIGSQLSALVLSDKLSDGFDINFNKTFNFQETLDNFMPERLRLNNRGYDDVLKFLKHYDLHELLSSGLETSELNLIKKYINFIIKAVEDLKNKITQVRNHASTVEIGSELSEKYARLHLASLSIIFFIKNRDSGNGFISNGMWLLLSLNFLLPEAELIQKNVIQNYQQYIFMCLIEIWGDKKAFSVMPFNYL